MILTTSRLVLRAFMRDDAGRFMALAGDSSVARMTSDIPHPVTSEQALNWLKPASGEARFAIELDRSLIGGVGYFGRPSGAAELGFWLGRDYWGRGYATEAAMEVVRLGFGAGRCAAFASSHFHDNPASGRVLTKLGFEPSGHGEIWSTARGQNVPANFVWLTRERAAQSIGLPSEERPKPSLLSTLFGRIAGNA